MPLTDVRIRSAKGRATAYKLSDGGGMYLLVTPEGARYWRMDYRHAGKRRTMALGVYPMVSLSDARSVRDEARSLLAKGIDPSQAKKDAKRAANEAGQNTFELVALEWLDSRNRTLTARYSALLLARLKADIFPQLGSRPIAEIDAPNLLAVLRKIEKRGAIETAHRMLQTCGAIFRYAVATGRMTRNPAVDLRGALKTPGRKKGHKAMPREDLPGFLSTVKHYEGEPRTRIALQLVVLTFVRTSELRGARWSEFNLDGNDPNWLIPAERMKMKQDHLVPLAPQVVALLRELQALPGSSHSPFVFPSTSKEGFMSNNTMLYALYRLGYHGRATVHGFRALASTVLNEEMGFRPDVIERQLAHQEGNKVRAAYNRAEYLDERRQMMDRWANFIDEKSGKNVRSLSVTTIGR